MPPRLDLRPVLGAGRSRWAVPAKSRASLCLFCSLAARPVAGAQALRRFPTPTRRAASTDSTAPTTNGTPNSRKELEDALLSLQTHAPNYVNLSRVQLALRNLRQPPGDESIRVAILAMANGAQSGRTAKKLSKGLLADPLGDVKEWEGQLEAHDTSQPLIIRVGKEHAHEGEPFQFAKGDLLPEINASSPPLNNNKLELLVMEIDPFTNATEEGIPALEETALVPTIEIPTSNTGGFTPLTTPVHKALLVGDGIRGAASVLSFPFLEKRSTIAAAVNFQQYTSEDISSFPFMKIDVDVADKSLALFREDISKAMTAGDLWDEGNLGAVTEWLKSGTVSNDEGTTKEAVRDLIRSLLDNTLATITEAEARQLSSALTAKVSAKALANLTQVVADWAQGAHEELQEQLDVAFTGRRWRKLGWWKLFWRVDDVGMLSSEMTNQRFLPQAERGLIYIAGRIREAGVTGHTEGPTYPGPILPPTASDNGRAPQKPTLELEGRWPTHIPFTRNYLLETTIPSLQALAQKLMAQSLSTSTVTTILGGLTYLSGFSLYEAGAVAGLGLVWSLRRLQKRWETARDYWQGEVREEGRKAVRASEASLREVLEQATKSPADEAAVVGELRRARELVQNADDALARLK